jgi:hypothetical protein
MTDTNPQQAEPLAADRERKIRDVVHHSRGWAGAPNSWTRMLHEVLAEVDRLRAASATAPAPADQARLRDRIAVVLAEADGWEYAKGLGLRDMSESMQQHYDKLADAVLAVLPEPTNQAADVERLRAKVYEWQGSYLDEVKVRQRRDAVLTRVRQMADAWEQRLPDVIQTAAAVGAIRHALQGNEIVPASGPGGVAGETPQPCTCGGPHTSTTLPSGTTYEEHRRDCALMQDGEQQPETQPRRMMRSRFPSRPGTATVASDMCPRCKGDNSEAWALCARCAETQADDDPQACTCAAAGDGFAPAGHYADCPQAGGQPARQSCPGFPDACPNLRLVVPTPGGVNIPIQCGCEPAAVSQPDGEAATSCSARPCNAAADELCDNHARIRYHAEGEHAFCKPGCTEEA